MHSRRRVPLPTLELPVSSGLGIDERVLAKAREFPDLVAIEDGGRRLTYRELDAASGALALRLRALGVGRERAVAVVAERSLEAAVAQLAILRARGFFVPLQPSLPEERLRFVLDDLDCAAVLSFAPLPFAHGRPFLSFSSALDPGPALPAEPAFAEELAYSIYTSGSTGKSKGVGGIHGATAALLDELDRHMPLPPGSRHAWTSSPHFDVTIFEVYGALATGGTLVVTPEAAKSGAAAYCRFVSEQRIATGEMPASFLAEFLAIVREDRLPFCFEALAVGTEPIPHQLLRDLLLELRRSTPGVRIFNYYGPTETTVSSTVFEVLAEGETRPGKTPIGRLFAGTRGCLARGAQPGALPGGADDEGELLLGGAGLTRGYLGRPALTAAAFVPDPDSAEPGARLYRTGDLARLLPSGDLEFLGRIDDQLKIRGYRIEPGEVATHLLRHPELREAVVIGHGRGEDARLLAYLAARDGAAPPSPAELRAFLRRSLPDYMVPGSYFFLPSLPKTSTGKVDRRALPPPESFAEGAGEGEAPRDGLEQRLASLWRDLLGVSAISRGDDFFQLGGHSLLAGRLLASLRQELGLELPADALFAAPTLEGLAAEIERRAAAAAGGPVPELPRAGLAPAYLPQPLSFAQERLYFLYRLQPDSASYNIPAAWRLDGPLDPAALARALALVEARHAALRTVFREQDGAPYQLVLPAAELSLAAEEATLETLEARLRRLAEAPFDLAAGPPWRHRLLALAPGRHVLFVAVHHIVFDGLSLLAFEKELAAAYAAEATGAELPAAPPFGYADFTVWQRGWLKAEQIDSEVAYWRGRLRTEPLELPTDRPRPPRQSLRGAVLRRSLPADLVARLEKLGRAKGATPFLTFLAPFLMLLSRLSGQRHVQVGVPFGGRDVPGSDGIFGFFVNTAVLGLEIPAGASFESLVKPLRSTLVGAFTHKEVPFEKLVAELSPERDPSRNPLFQVSFQLLEGEAEAPSWPGLAISREPTEVRAARFDFEPLLQRGKNGEIEIEALYATDLFDEATVARWLALYELLLREIAASPARPLETITLLDPESRALYAAVNANATGFPREASLAAIFAARADEAPDAIAMECRGETLSYRQLDERTNRLARLLRSRGAMPGSMVGLCFERGIDLAASILAVVKTGAAYVPLDGDYPEARLRGMVEDTAMPLLLGSRAQISRLPDLGLPMLALEDLADELAAGSAERLPFYPGGLAPAVVIFTSGSTGRPKGVVVTQRAICRLVIDTNYIAFRPGDVVAQVSAASFDVYTFEIWGALLHGGRLLVIGRETLLDPRAFAAAIQDREIAALFLTVALFTQMMLEEPQAFVRVRHLMFGGEACEPSVARRALAFRPAHLQNGYGPAECTTYATTFDVLDLAEDAGSVPIGKPVANTEVLVLDRAGRPAAIGVQGELCLGGDGLALGYWRRPALTAGSFVPHPGPAAAGARLYRTGDLARLLPSGDFDYLGRIDFQVKVRGYRIELGEVEAVLGRHPAVREKIALTQGKSRDQRLIAFVTVQKGEAGQPLVSAAELERFAAETLPSFAVPQLHLLEVMPITPNGKIDRRALPQLEQLQRPAETSSEKPRTPREEQVAAAFGKLLGVAEIGRDADFFTLGGHSLLATRLVAQLREQSGIELPVAALFAGSTVASLAAALEEIELGEAAAPENAAAIESQPSGGLSFAQQRLYFLHRFSPESPVYNLPAAWRFSGPLDRARLAAALAALEERQEILRTRFRDEDGEGRAELLPPGELELPLEEVAEERLDARLAELAEEPFDLLREKPWRARLLALADGDHVLFVVVHHIAFDGISLRIFENELAAFYRDPGLRLPPLAPSYADYAARQKARLAGPELEKQLAFWRGRAGDEPLELPTDRPRPPVPSFRGGNLERELPAELVAAIEELGRRQGATPFLAFLAPFLMLLARLSGQREVNVGVPFSGRHDGEADEVIGFFINTLLLGAKVDDDPSFATLLPRLRQDFAAVYAHQDVPFEKLVEELGITRDPSRNPLYQATFQLFEESGEAPDFGALAATPLEPELAVAKFDLDLLLDRRPGGALRISAWYAADLFDAATVAGWLELYQILLAQVAAAPTAPLSRLPLLRPADRALYARVNDNATAFPRDANLLALFADRVAEGPERVAAELHGKVLTYAELDRRTNRLARRLRDEGIVPGSMVGVCIERGIDLVVAILAIVKTGSAYVPLDADYPAERLAGMVDDTRMPLVLAGALALDRLPAGLGARVLALAEAEAAAARLSAEPLGSGHAFAESAANVIFTSGSTGRPKGVVVTHRGVLRLVRDTNYMTFQPGDVVMQVSSASFDVYTFELWGALVNGGRLLVIDRDTLLQPSAFAAALAGREIAALFLTVTLFGQMVAEQPQAFRQVRHLFFGGEACEPNVARRALENPPGHLQNGYGPTECTCYACVYEVTALTPEARSVPIGPPVANTEVLVIDRFGQIAPVGVHGELCLGGDGLAWGYWRRPALTAGVFVPHPHPALAGERLYRTGDLARLLPSGDFDYLGRIDFQVKVRGYRIELGEIETVLGRHPAVREKIALTRGQGAAQLLVAFVTVERDADGEPLAGADELQRHCAAHLPAFAVPLVRLLPVMPLTPNGKIDRRALPADDLFESSAATSEPPRGELEQAVAATWAEVLAVPPPGREADFFALGGHSLAAMRILSALHRQLGFEAPLPLLFTHPGLSDFAAAFGRMRDATAARRPADAAPETAALLPRRQGEGPWPLSFGQERMWLLDLMRPGSSAFNMPFPLRLRGQLDRGLLARALGELEARHESLRTAFVSRDGVAYQEVRPPSFAMEYSDLSALPAAERERHTAELRDREAAAPFDLARPPLFRAHLVRLGEGEHLLLTNFHHAAFDGWSAGVFFRELRQLLEDFAAERPSSLPEPGLPYIDFALWQRELLQGELLERQLGYWREQLRGAAPILALPLDRPRQPAAERRGAFELGAVEPETVSRLRRLAVENRAPLFPLLLAAFQVLLQRLSGQDDILVGIPVADRPRQELENTLGFFLNTLVIRNQVDGATPFEQLFAATRDTVLAAREHQTIPFEKLVLELQPERSTSQTPFFQVLFNFANLPDSTFELPGLKVEMEKLDDLGAKVDLNLYLFEAGDGLDLQLVYDADLFDRARMRELLRQYAGLLAQIAADPARPAGAYSLRTPVAERHLPDPAAALPNVFRGTIAGGFLRHAARDPGKIAIEDPWTRYSYGELAVRSAAVAARLVAEGIGRGEVVAIWAHRSAPLVEALLGILRAGAAFVVFDPAYPLARLFDYLELAQPRLILALEAAGPLPAPLEEAALAAGVKMLPLPAAGLERRDFADQELTGDDLAYVAFTSGSTGRPKAILGRHASLTAFLPFIAENFGLGADDRHSLLSALSHDPLHRDVMMPLYFGATLAIPDAEQIFAPGYLARWAAAERLTLLNLVPAMLQLLVHRDGEAPVELPALRRVFTVGDVLQRADIDALYAIAPQAVAINLYGSTETQRAVSYVVLPRSLGDLDPESELGTLGLAKASLPVGRGYDGVQLVLRNAQGELTGVGEVGEIYMRSFYLSRGYADTAQTAERFLDNPFAEAPQGDRLYRTGDLGRYLPDGQVEFLGRADFQVKIRGFRIELQEIEAALAKQPAIDQNVVVVREDARGEKRLIAYFVTRHGFAEPAARDLRAALLTGLPDYMVPAVFVALRALPLTQTGKLDRMALPPAPEETGEQLYRAPAAGAEAELAVLWEGLLGRRRVGAADHFFELGGHSLLATRLLARIRDAFGVSLPLRAVFEAPTVEGMAAQIRLAERERDEEGDPGGVRPPLVAAPRPAGRLPLSFSQQRLWFLDQLEPESTAYLLAGAVALRGELDAGDLEQAFLRLAARHEALRTRIETEDGEGWQVIAPASAPYPAVLRRRDLRGLPEGEREAAARQIAEELARTPIPLSAERLLRLDLLQLGEDHHWLVLAIHHIVADGWSVGILLRELAEIYSALRDGRAAQLPALALQPADVALWERSWLHGAALERQLGFWRRALAGAPHALELPTDRPRPSSQTFRGARLPIRVPALLAGRLRQLGRDEGATLFMVLLGAYQLLLGRLSGQDAVVVGTPAAHREHTALEGLIGFFANALPLRLDIDPAAGFAEHLGRLRHTALDAFSHQDLPFEKLVAELGVERDLARSPVFQTMFALQNLEAQASTLGDVALETIELELGRAQVDLNWVLYEEEGGDEGLAGFLEWNVDLFRRDTVERFAGRLLHLLEQVVDDPRKPAGALSIETAEDAALRRGFNAAGENAATGETALLTPQAIAARMAAQPDAVAIGLEGEAAYTYAELWRAADRLARRLTALGAGAETPIGLSVGRTPAMVVAQLAIWRAGAAYLPLDPIYPADRLVYMLEDSGARILIVDSRDEAAPEALRAAAAEVVDLALLPDEDFEDGWTAAETTPRSLAYVLYTSGSTGKPKGVMIEHGSLANFLASMALRPGLAAGDRLLSVTTLSFDISGLEIWLPLYAGARVDLARRATLQDPEALAAVAERCATTVLQATPATWRMLLDGGFAGRPGMKALCGGEALPGELARRILAKVGSLWNVYGPTETTIWSTTRQVRAEEFAGGETGDGEAGDAMVTLGSPIAHTQIHILDPAFAPLPPGVPGQLCIGGRGLARGYFGRPALTAERFRPDPFSAEPGARLYQTGDLARLRLDGELEFLGRLDFQVKVRGFRIELGEIEAVLLAHPAVAEAVVAARGDGPSGARLVGYYRAAEGEPPPEVPELQDFLRRSLPDYMVPPQLMRLDSFPLTPNLKIDRRALPAPETVATGEGRPPETPVELLLAAIWQELLPGARVGADDSFFSLGGDSILVIQVVARARAQGLGLKPHDLFQRPTLAALAAGASFAGPAQEEVDDVQLLHGVEVVGELSDAELDDLLESL